MRKIVNHSCGRCHAEGLIKNFKKKQVMTQQVLEKRISAIRSRKNSSHRVTQGMLTESHTAVFRCELCEKLCETLWETLSLT